MKKSLGYRLFRIGKMPPPLKAILAQGGVLASGEGVSIKFSAHGLRLPGRYSSRSVRWHSGAIVVTADRIGLSVGRMVLLDSAFAIPVTTAEAMQLTRYA